MMPAADYIAVMTDRIVEEFAPVRMIQFGSQTRGDAGPKSEVDLLVVLPSADDKRKAAIRIRRARAGFPVSTDVIVTPPEENARRGDLVGTVLPPALREGKAVCERTRAPPRGAGCATRWRIARWRRCRCPLPGSSRVKCAGSRSRRRRWR
jgi:uncharacterized protein